MRPVRVFVETSAGRGLAVTVGIVAAAAAVSLTAGSSLIDIVGAVVAAALVPAAGAAGVAFAWSYPPTALGSVLLVVTTVVAIDLAILAAFPLIGYRPSPVEVPSRRAALRVAAVALAIGSVVAGTGAATASRVVFERDVDGAVDVVADTEGVSTVSARSGYADPETETAELRRTDGESYPELADRIAAATGREVAGRVEFADRRESARGGVDRVRVVATPRGGWAARC